MFTGETRSTPVEESEEIGVAARDKREASAVAKAAIARDYDQDYCKFILKIELV